MTVGEKIRKYRILKGWTQKELGLKVGFSAATADSRIRKYESDAMAPKADIRTKLANALGVDLSALSDVNVSSYEDVMQVLFQFEDDLGMEIDKKDGQTYLIFNDNNTGIRTLITYMNMWRNQKKALLPKPENASKDQMNAYEAWKARFAGNTADYFSGKEKEINEHYRLPVKEVLNTHTYARTTADITLLLRKIIEAGFTVSTTYIGPLSVPGFTFVVNELLTPPSSDAETLFARFLAELGHFSDLGAKTYTEMQMTGKSLTITYFIPVTSFSVIKSQIDDLLKYLKTEENDFTRDTFEMMFEDGLKTNYNNIEDEIRFYCNK